MDIILYFYKKINDLKISNDKKGINQFKYEILHLYFKIFYRFILYENIAYLNTIK